jgi:uncharacterized repeat protein (TIGR01451 family)/fimbrial isopeptide formation D2 family protein
MFIARRLRVVLVGACLVPALLAGTAGSARAAGRPSIALDVLTPSTILFQAHGSVALTASNPEGQPYGYNLSYRAELPAGVSYVPGSAHLEGGGSPAPQVIEDHTTGVTTLTWSDVGDLSPSSHDTLDFEVGHSSSAYAVGREYKVVAGAYISELPRYLPKFDSEGKPVEGSYTGSAGGSSSTKLTALEIKQAQLTYPEGEVLRGVHNHQFEYQVSVTNTTGGPTDEVLVNDWLPADVEYLGCGSESSKVDHTIEAPSNPGSREEYPGSGEIKVKPLSGCVAPALVETLETNPDGAEESPTGVYTHLQWKVPTMAAGETRTFTFPAAVPLRENTTSWPHGQPTPQSDEQAANLDNNSGRETKDGEQILTYAKAEGEYKHELPLVSASDHLSLTAKDIATEKTTAQTTLEDGQLTTWKILVHSSEYRYNTGITVTDTLPNGLCPTVSSSPRGAECEPITPGNPAELSSPAYASSVENANGTWTIAWNPGADPVLANLKQNETTEIILRTRTRTHYWGSGAPGEPILAHDHVTNEVVAAGTANVVCDGDSDCEGVEPTHIFHEGELTQEIQDNSHASQAAGGPTIEKQVADAGSGAECLADTYTSTIPVFHPGDTVCWLLKATFPTATFTHSEQITDFLPAGAAFNTTYGQRPTGTDTLAGTSFSDSEAGGAEGGEISWTLPESGRIGTAQIFERVYATSAHLPGGVKLGDLQGNLMKLSSSNTEKESFALRSEADYALQFPELTLEKKIIDLNGIPEATPASSATVDGGELATFELTVKNLGEVEADHAVVIDDLPVGITCAEITGITAEGSCEGTSGTERLIWGETGLGAHTPLAVPGKGQTSLRFTVEVKAPTDPGRVFEDHAGVKTYESATNSGGQFTYIPEDNIEPLREAEPLRENEAHVPAARAAAMLVTEGVSMSKAHTTDINEAGNDVEQATIGEGVDYEVSATIPAGTSLASEAVLSDPGLKAEGLQYVEGSAKAYVNGVEAGAEYTVTELESGGSGTGRVPSLSLPAGVQAPTTGPLTVTLKFRVVTANESKNKNGEKIKNTGKLTWRNSLGEAKEATAGNELPIVEPLVKLSEEDSAAGPVHGGQEVEYKLHAKDEAGASAANDVRLVERVAAGVVPLTGAGGSALANHQKLANGGEWIEAALGGEYAGEIVWEHEQLTPGQEQLYAYFGKVEASPSASASLKDKATVTVTSLPKADGEGRTAQNAPGTTKARYEASTGKTLEVQQMTIEKEVRPATATIGQRVLYTLKVTLPAHVSSYNTTVLDTLPDSLDVDRLIAAECTSGCGAAPLTIRPYAPGIGEGPTTLAWSIGEVLASAEARTVKIEYEADVRATHRTSPHTEVKTPLTIENGAHVSYDQKGPEKPFEEGTIPTGLEKSIASVHKDVTLVEPKLKVTKEVSVNGGTSFSPGPVPVHVSDRQLLLYRVTVKNEGNGTAYGVAVSDPLPATLIEARATRGTPTHAWSTGEPEFSWVGESLAAGATITYEYEAHVTDAKNLSPNEKIENKAALAAYHGVSEAELHVVPENYNHEPVGYRTYTGAKSAVTGEVQLPSIKLEKSGGGADAEVGQLYEWHVTVTNESSVPVKHVRIADKLPQNWEYKAGSAGFSKGSISSEAQSGSLGSGLEELWESEVELMPSESDTISYEAIPLIGAETTPGAGPSHPNVNIAHASVESLAGASEDALGKFEAGPAEAAATLTLPSLAIKKTVLTKKVAAGEQDSYTIEVKNVAETATAHNVVVTDTLPDTPGTTGGITYTRGSATSNVTSPQTFEELSGVGTTVEGGGAVRWKISALEPGKEITITMPVEIGAALEPVALTNKAEAVSDEQTTPVKAEAEIETTTEADLAAHKQLKGATEVVPGEQVAYTIGASNAGPSVARAVKLTDRLPAGTSFVSASPGCVQSAGTVICEAARVEPGREVSYEVVLKLESGYDAATPTSPKELENTVEVASSTHDPNPGNDTHTVHDPSKPRADLSLLETAAAPTPLDGQEARFTLQASNAGPSDASDAKIVDELPTGMEYLSAAGATCAPSAGDVICELGTLAANGSTSVELVVRVHGTGTLENHAHLESAVEDPNPANNAGASSVSVMPAAELTLEKTVTPEEIEVPGEVTYTLTVSNKGPDAAQTVLVSDPLPAGESYRSDDAGCKDEGQLVTCALGEISDGQSRTVELKVRVGVSLGDQIVTNTASVSSTTGDPTTLGTTATAKLKTGPTADVAITKTGPATAIVGEPITWTLDVLDNGPSTAHGVKLVDPLPAGVIYSGSTTSQGVCGYASGALECELGELADGAHAQVTVTGSDSVAGQITNTATVSAQEPDPEPANNSSSATTAVSTPPASSASTISAPTPVASAPRTSVTLRSTVGRRSVSAGEHLTYKLTVRNTGTAAALDLEICDPLPSHTTILSRGGGHLDKGTVCYRLAKLDPGKSHTFLLRLRADSDVRGKILDLARVGGVNFLSPKPARTKTPVRGQVEPHRESGVTG